MLGYVISDQSKLDLPKIGPKIILPDLKVNNLAYKQNYHYNLPSLNSVKNHRQQLL